MPRGLGGRDCQAPRLALRAPPVAALAEDEMRGEPGVRRRRLHRSAGRARRPGRAAGRLLRGRRLRFRRQGRHGVRHRSCCSICARGSTPSRSRAAVHQGGRAPARARALGAAEIVVQVAFIEWTVHGKLRHPRLLGVRARQARAMSCGSSRDHAPGEGAVPRRRHHQGRARAVLRGGRAADAAAHPRPPGHHGALPAGIGTKGFLQKDVSKGFPEWLERVEVPKKGGTVHHPLVDRRALAAVAGQPELHHAARLDVARAGSVSPGHLRLRSRSVATTSRRCCARRRSRLRDLLASWACRAGSRPPARRASTSSCRSTARPASATSRGSRTRVGARAGRTRSRAPDAGVQQGRPRRAHPRRHRPQRLQRDLRRGLRRAREAGRAGLGAVHLGGARERRGRCRRPSRCAPWPAASRRVGDLWADMRRGRRSLRRAMAQLTRG